MTQTLSILGSDAPDASALSNVQLLDIYPAQTGVTAENKRFTDFFFIGRHFFLAPAIKHGHFFRSEPQRRPGRRVPRVGAGHDHRPPVRLEPAGPPLRRPGRDGALRRREG